MIYFYFTTTGVVLCGGCPYIIHGADYILFQSIEMRGYILNNQKISVGLDSCSRSSFLSLWVPFDIIQSFNRLPYQI